MRYSLFFLRNTIIIIIFSLNCLPAFASESFWTYDDFKKGLIPHDFKIKNVHPRLFITEANKKEIIHKIKAAPELWKRTIKNAESGRGDEMVLSCAALYQIGLVPGFRYRLTLNQYAEKAISSIYPYKHSNFHEKGSGTYEVFTGIYTIACAYDWLYPVLTEEQKHNLIQNMILLSKNSKFLYTLNGPNGRGMLLGLAFYGDGLNDKAAKEIIERYYNEIWWKDGTEKEIKSGGYSILSMIRYEESGGYHEGHYIYRNASFWPIIRAWETATGQNYFKKMGYFRNFPYWIVHMNRNKPYNSKGGFQSIAFHRFSGADLGRPNGVTSMCAAATGYLKDIDPKGAALSRWILDNSVGYNNIVYPLIFGILMGDPSVKGKSPEEIALSKSFVIEHDTKVYMRSNWGDPDATHIGFANSRFRMRASGANSIAIYKNGGPLFLYRGKIARHQYCKGHGTWPFNSVIFYKQNHLIPPKEMTKLPLPYHAKLIEHGSTDTYFEKGEYDYVRGSCPELYSNKIKQAERSMIYLRSFENEKKDYVVLLDRIDSGSKKIKPHIVFNTVFEPIVGKNWDDEIKGDIVLDGQWSIENAPNVIVTNNHLYSYVYSRKRLKSYDIQSHARAFLKTLYPPEIKTIKIGGKQHFMDGIGGKGSDDKKLYKKFLKSSKGVQISLGGYWRFHIIPKTNNSSHIILNAIELTDSKIKKPGKLKLIENNSVIGAQAGPNIILFSKTGKKLASGTVRITGSNIKRIIIADLIPEAKYLIKTNHTNTETISTKAGTALFKTDIIPEGDTISFSKQ